MGPIQEQPDPQTQPVEKPSFVDNMTEDKSKEFATVWLNKFWGSATRRYGSWFNRFLCGELEDMYCGLQWKEAPEGYRPYVANLMFGTVQTQLPSSSFRKIQAYIKPKPYKSDFDMNTAAKQSKLRQDAVNTFLGDSRNGVVEALQLAQLNAYSRFGVIEVGYAANWMVNPKYQPGPNSADNFQDNGNENEVSLLEEPPFEPEHENIYWKYIPAKQFRVGAGDKWILDRSPWAGYYEDVFINDLKANPAISPMLKDLPYTPSSASDEYYDNEFDPALAGDENYDGRDSNRRPARCGDQVRIVHIFDYKARMRHIFLDLDNIYLASLPFKRNPLKVLKYHPIMGRDTFYPIPPMYNWMSAQEDYNECREALREFRRRFKRKFIVKKGFFQEDELDKFLDNYDGTVAEAESTGPLSDGIIPGPQVAIGAETIQSMMADKGDFNEVSGTPSDQRGQADRQSATQSVILDKRAGIRENSVTETNAIWICDIISETCKLQAEKLTLPFWVKVSVDSDSITAMEETAETAQTWQQIIPLTAFDEDFEFDVNVNISSLSPLENEKEKNAMLEFLAVLNTYPQIAMSEKLVREIAERVSYRNEAVIREFQYMAQLAALGAAEQAAAAVGGLAERTTQQATPPDQQQITNQIANQTGLPSQ